MGAAADSRTLGEATQGRGRPVELQAGRSKDKSERQGARLKGKAAATGATPWRSSDDGLEGGAMGVENFDRAE
jgi:hypothetical protein